MFTPEEPGDVASASLAAALKKTSQAGAPVMVGDRLWGELWVATCGMSRVLGWADRERLEAAAELVGKGLEAIGFIAPPPVYRIVVRGRIDSLLLDRFKAHAPQHIEGMTRFEVAMDAQERDNVIAALKARRFKVVRMERRV